MGRHSEGVRAGEWVASPDFSYAKSPLVELAGKTLGLVGYGDIGRKVAGIGRAFGMNVLVNRRSPQPETVGLASQHQPGEFVERSRRG